MLAVITNWVRLGSLVANLHYFVLLAQVQCTDLANHTSIRLINGALYDLLLFVDALRIAALLHCGAGRRPQVTSVDLGERVLPTQTDRCIWMIKGLSGEKEESGTNWSGNCNL